MPRFNTEPQPFQSTVSPEDYEFSFFERMGAVANRTFEESIFRSLVNEYTFLPEDLEKVVSPEEAHQRFQEAGIQTTGPQENVSEAEFQIQKRRALDRQTDEFKISSAPQTLANQSAAFATSLATSFMDPANVLLAFTPVAGIARVMGNVGRAASAMRTTRSFGQVGRAALSGPKHGRFLEGSIEGFSGTLLAEPLVKQQANRDLREYTLQETFLNLTLGTLLGGGLHVATGTLADWYTRNDDMMSSDVGAMVDEALSRKAQEVDRLRGPSDEPTVVSRVESLSPENKELVMKAALRYENEGRTPDVDSVLEMAEDLSAKRKEPLTQEEAENVRDLLVEIQDASRRTDNFDSDSPDVDEVRPRVHSPERDVAEASPRVDVEAETLEVESTIDGLLADEDLASQNAEIEAEAAREGEVNLTERVKTGRKEAEELQSFEEGGDEAMKNDFLNCVKETNG